MPLVRDALGGLLLRPVDLAINKVLALAGRDEPRDFVDLLFVHARVLPLAALAWAAVGKDPGLTPLSLVELLKRHGRYRPEDFGRLRLTEPFDLARGKATWLAALADAERFARVRPADGSAHALERIPSPSTITRSRASRPESPRMGEDIASTHSQPL